jgi:molybdate transport system substrate-binding protein
MNVRHAIVALIAGAGAVTHFGTAAAADTVVLRAMIASSGYVAFGDIFAAYEKRHPRVRFESQPGLGGQQIEAAVDGGAPADIVMMANPNFDLVQDETVAQTAILTNTEVVLVPRSNPANISELKDLANPNVKLVIGLENSVAGRFARQVLKKAGATYGFDVEVKMRGNVVVEESSAGAVVAALASGKNGANAAIAFVSDQGPRFSLIAIPATQNVRTIYSISTTKASKNQAAAKDFIAFVASPAGQAILAAHHYEKP